MDDAVDAALRALDAAPDGWLGLPERRRLLAAFGPATPPYEGGPNAGLLRRAALLDAVVRRALPAWDEAFPDDRRPHELIGAVLPALRGERHEDEVWTRFHALEDDVERLGTARGLERVFFAGRAAVDATWQAWDGDLDPELYGPETTDSDLDEPRVEFLCAWAVAGDDPEARRAFWRWYVTEAFPAAYAVVP